ncbi:MAG: hypothetical protein ABGY29_03085 [bacterium]
MSGLSLWVLDSRSGEVYRIPYHENADPDTTDIEDLLIRHGLYEGDCQWMLSEARSPAELPPTNNKPKEPAI